MKIVAETRNDFLVSATSNELKEIITSVTGARPEKIEIGQKIPAIDYATTITKIKTLQDNYEFKQLFLYVERFYGSAKDLEKAVVDANNIES